MSLVSQHSLYHIGVEGLPRASYLPYMKSTSPFDEPASRLATVFSQVEGEHLTPKYPPSRRKCRTKQKSSQFSFTRTAFTADAVPRDATFLAPDDMSTGTQKNTCKHRFVLMRDNGVAGNLLEMAAARGASLPSSSAETTTASFKGRANGCEVAGLSPNTLYHFRVRAVNTRTRSALSAPLEVK